MQPEFKAGDRVKHATRTDWGFGEVLADSSGGRIKVLFEDFGYKEFDASLAKFTKVEGEESESGYLSALVANFNSMKNRPSTGKTEKHIPLTFPDVVRNFLSFFRDGFHDPSYLDGKSGERNYKVDAHKAMLRLLNQSEFRELLEQGKFTEICDRAKSIINKTNLIHQYEKIWLNNGLKIGENEEKFAKSLFDLLFGVEEMGMRFDKFSKMLYEIGAAKWPIATYFLFIMYPDEHIFLKPQVTQNAADVLNMEISYRPELNWLTYKQVQQLAKLVRSKLIKDGREMLVPRDMIDVQSFIWVIAPGYCQ